MPSNSEEKIRRRTGPPRSNLERDNAILAPGEPLTLREIAEKFGISKQRVGQIRRRAKLAESGQESVMPETKRSRKRATALIGSIRMNYDDAIVWAVDHYWKSSYRPPTIREIQKLTGIPSTSHVRDTVHRLAKKTQLAHQRRAFPCYHPGVGGASD